MTILHGRHDGLLSIIRRVVGYCRAIRWFGNVQKGIEEECGSYKQCFTGIARSGRRLFLLFIFAELCTHHQYHSVKMSSNMRGLNTFISDLRVCKFRLSLVCNRSHMYFLAPNSSRLLDTPVPMLPHFLYITPFTIVLLLLLSLEQAAPESRRKSESTRSWRISDPTSRVISAGSTGSPLIFDADGNMNGYQKRKYVCKLMYIYLLGWEVDFGHMEAVNLISSNKYSEKQVVSSVECE